MIFYLTTIGLVRFLTEDSPIQWRSNWHLAKELWESLDKKYKDVGAKKYIASCYLDFKMVDSKTVVSKVQELQLIFYEIHV